MVLQPLGSRSLSFRQIVEKTEREAKPDEKQKAHKRYLLLTLAGGRLHKLEKVLKRIARAIGLLQEPRARLARVGRSPMILTATASLAMQIHELATLNIKIAQDCKVLDAYCHKVENNGCDDDDFQ